MKPLVFKPVLKQIRWGGRRLGTVLGKPIGTADDYAESWEVCDHAEGQSVVADGEYAGWTLRELMQKKGAELLGETTGRTQFPLLIKYLDCHDRLSVQVHPDDQLAKQFNPTENGKTEAWVVLQAEPGSVIFAGFRTGITAADVQAALQSGDLEAVLHRIEPQPGDCYFIPAGTVHALGEGVLIAEVQQASDLTFRLHDWGRLDREGKSRPLHLDESFACLTFPQPPVQAITPRTLQETAAGQRELLVECDYFRLIRYRWNSLSQPWTLPSQNCCRILMGLAGKGTVHCAGETFPLPLGQTLLLPATSPVIELQPDSTAVDYWQILVAEVQ